MRTDLHTQADYQPLSLHTLLEHGDPTNPNCPLRE